MMRCFRTLGLCCIVGLGLAALAWNGTAMAAEDTVLSSTDFEAKVVAAGGRVDFVFGDDRPFAQCHASTLSQAPNGDLLCAWFGGTHENNPDVSIWLSRFSDGAWQTPEKVAKVAETAHWNPVLFYDEDKTVYLFFKVGVDVSHWTTWWMKSKDNGVNWSKPRELFGNEIGGRGPVKNKPIILSNGDWLAPASSEFKGIWVPFADISTDHGRNWNRTADWFINKRELKSTGAIQPTLWESKPGHVHALMRTAAGKVWRTDSKDYGRTWCDVYETELPNNNSGLDLVALPDKRLFLVYNPVSKSWGPRTPLDLAVAKGVAKEWTTVAHLEDDKDKEAEYSYPAIIKTQTGIALCYTWKRDKVRCWQIPLSAL